MGMELSKWHVLTTVHTAEPCYPTSDRAEGSESRWHNFSLGCVWTLNWNLSRVCYHKLVTFGNRPGTCKSFFKGFFDLYLNWSHAREQ